MKIQTNKKTRGLTLIELTVVIVVLLSLIGALFIGATAWKNGADRGTCIVNLRNFQVAMRSFANINELDAGDACTEGDLITAGFITGTGSATNIDCPLDADQYVFGDEVTPDLFDPGSTTGTSDDVSNVYVTCLNAAVADGNHTPNSTEGW